MAMNGALSGLVSITAGCTVIEPWAAIIAGVVGGLLYVAMSRLLIKWRLDDAVDAIPVHLPNGIWGLIVVGLLATPTYVMEVYGSPYAGWFYSWAQGSADGRLLAANLVEILFVTGWVTCTMYPFFFVLNYLGWFRSDPLEEIIGLDISYHGSGALNVENDEVYTLYLQENQANHRSGAGRSISSMSSLGLLDEINNSSSYGHDSEGNLGVEIDSDANESH